MKKLFLFSGIFALLGFCQVQAQEKVEIKGKLDIVLNHSVVRLLKPVEGRMVEIASAKGLEEGDFGFSFYPAEESFYVIGFGGPNSLNNNYTFYFKPGDKLDLTINDSTYTLNGKSISPENQVLNKWHNEILNFEQKVVNSREKYSRGDHTMPQIDALYKRTKTFAKENPTKNKQFNHLLPILLDVNYYSLMGEYFQTKGMVVRGKKDLIGEFLHGIKPNTFTHAASDVHQLPWGNPAVEGYVHILERIRKPSELNVPRTYEVFERKLTYLNNDTLKGDILANYLYRQNEFEKYDEAYQKYGELITLPKQEELNMSTLIRVAKLKPGDQGLNFKYPNLQGEMVQFNDFKGKVVLLDMWASWCHACRAEVPALKKLEEELKDNPNFVVVSITLDVPKDRDKWLKAMKDDGTEHNIQLWANGWTYITKYYNFTTIPQFMLFDKEGKIITLSAPRPSDPKLKELILKHL